jgi:hypothetical protein
MYPLLYGQSFTLALLTTQADFANKFSTGSGSPSFSNYLRDVKGPHGITQFHGRHIAGLEAHPSAHSRIIGDPQVFD